MFLAILLVVVFAIMALVIGQPLIVWLDSKNSPEETAVGKVVDFGPVASAATIAGPDSVAVAWRAGETEPFDIRDNCFDCTVRLEDGFIGTGNITAEQYRTMKTGDDVTVRFQRCRHLKRINVLKIVQ